MPIIKLLGADIFFPFLRGHHFKIGDTGDLQFSESVKFLNPAGKYMFKAYNRNTRTRCEMFKVNSKDTRTTPKALFSDDSLKSMRQLCV